MRESVWRREEKRREENRIESNRRGLDASVAQKRRRLLVRRSAMAAALRPLMMMQQRSAISASSSLNCLTPPASSPAPHSAATAQSRSAPLASPLVTTVCSSRGCHQRRLRFPVKAVPGQIWGVEPDLPEDYIEGSEYWTAGQDTQETDFPYGKADGAHSWHEGDDNVEFIDAMSIMITEAGGPNDNRGQAIISWLFPPVVCSGFAFGVQPEYLFLAAVLFIFAFIGIEMTKPDKPSNFEYDSNFPGPGYKP